MTVKNLEELKNAIENGAYETSQYVRKETLDKATVIDEDRTVKWNREEVVRLNKQSEDRSNEYVLERNRLSREMDSDIIKVFSTDSNLNEEQIAILYNYVYRELHSYGIHEVIQELDSMIDLFNEVNEKGSVIID